MGECWHGVCINDTIYPFEFLVDKIYCVVGVVSFEPYADVPCSEDVHGIVEVDAVGWLVREASQGVQDVDDLPWTDLQ